MADLYKVMTHSPAQVTWEDDSFAAGWSAMNSEVNLYRDGDILTIWLYIYGGTTQGYAEKSGLNVNALTYRYMIVCVKGDGDFRLDVYDGAWKIVQAMVAAPTDYDVKVYDLASITTGTVTAVRLWVGSVQNKLAYYDFVAFASAQPTLLTDLTEMMVHQKESDLDEFEILKDGGTLNLGYHIRIWLNSVKVFAGVIEESTPEEAGILHASGRCFGQKLLLRTKNKDFSNREVSLAAKDFVEDLTEVTTFQVETPSPTVTVTKDYRYEYVMDGLKDFAKKVGSDWEVKLGMGHDLRFRSRSSANVPNAPAINESDGKILMGVRKETDAFRLFNKVTVVGSELSNIDNDPDKYSDEGDIVNWSWQIFGGGGGSLIIEDPENIAYGKCSIRCIFTYYSNTLTAEFDMGTSGIDLTVFKYLKFMHRSTGIARYPPETNFYFRARLRDTAFRNAVKTYLSNNTQPPTQFAEASLALDEFTVDSGFDWQHVRYVQFQCLSDRTNPDEGVGGYYWLDFIRFYTPNITKSAIDSASSFKHTREYVLRDEKLIDPGFVSEVASALLNVLKSQENRFRLPILGTPAIQVGHKVSVNSPTHGLNGTYYIVEAEHKVTPSEGYVTEMILERPRLYLETLLAEAIERKIKLIERGDIA